MTAACYESGNNNDESDNNKDKVCLLSRKWGLMGHVLDHILDYVLDHMLDHIFNRMLDYMIIGLVTTSLQ